MHAEPEGGVAVVQPVDEDLVGAVELGEMASAWNGSIPVRRADRAAAQLVAAVTMRAIHRPVGAGTPPPRWGSVRVRDQAVTVVGVAGQVEQRRADGDQVVSMPAMRNR